ncbi:MAG: arsenical pump-driving ATPase [Burkholderiaceae bacterium]|nr:MAG: arsenical pump-driving ATPase [Burkholderiaceae bacterium]
MHFLQTPPRYFFFTGKGGVGKTSVACASALQLAQQGRRVLLVSTDPASNIAQVFQQAIGPNITALDFHENLYGIEIDPHVATDHYRQRIIDPLRSSLTQTELQHLTEQLSGACTTEIAAFDEFTNLLTDPALQSRFEHIIFDTAPTGHTLRLLQLPAAWSDFIAAGKGSASCLGPLAGLEKQRQQYQSVVDTLCDTQQTRMVLVARAQSSSLREAARTHHELNAIGMRQHYLVINACMPFSEAEHDQMAKAIYQREQALLDDLPQLFKPQAIDQLSLRPFNVVGKDALNKFFESEDEDLEQRRQPTKVPEPNPPLSLKHLIDEIEADQHGLIMTMGKGGVGKTTIAAAIAFELAKRGHSVHLSSSDPAANLSDTITTASLAGHLDAHLEANLSVSRIDPEVETQRYRAHILASKANKLDADQLRLIEEDLASPCTQEIAVFHAFSRILRESNKKFVVMDTAPTGHTLLLLDTTGAYHKEIERQMNAHGMRFTTPMMQLRDPQQTKIILITLAETTPVLEAKALQADLQRAGITPWAWVINNGLAYSRLDSALLQHRAAQERQEIDALCKQHPPRLSYVAMQKENPIGGSQLAKL